MMQLAFLNLGPPELIVILIVALLLFGSRLPTVMRSLGQSINQFKKGMGDVVEDAPLEAPAEDTSLKDKDEAKA